MKNTIADKNIQNFLKIIDNTNAIVNSARGIVSNLNTTGDLTLQAIANDTDALAEHVNNIIVGGPMPSTAKEELAKSILLLEKVAKILENQFSVRALYDLNDLNEEIQEFLHS